MARTNGSTEVKRERDYATLLDDAMLRMDGYSARLSRSERELRRLLGNHQNANQIMQVITRPRDGYGAVSGQMTMLAAKIKLYERGFMEQNAGRTVVAIPVNPDDDSADVVDAGAEAAS